MYEKEFIDFIYNRYVDAVRRHDSSDLQYWKILDNCMSMLSMRKYAALRRHARERLKDIKRAIQSEPPIKLRKVGQEGEIEFRKEIEDYEKRLREFNFSEDFIRERIIQKREDYHKV